jgi:sarcosine oxidase
MYEAHLRGRLAGVTSRAVKAAACMYVMTPDFNFIIDDHPAMDRVTVVSACSGHGFKHSAGIGFALAERAATGRSKMDLAPFALSRFDGRG